MLTAFAVTECINNYRIEQQFQQSNKKRQQKSQKKERRCWDTAIKFNFVANKDEKERRKKRKKNIEGLCRCTRNSYGQTLR